MSVLSAAALGSLAAAEALPQASSEAKVDQSAVKTPVAAAPPQLGREIPFRVELHPTETFLEKQGVGAAALLVSLIGIGYTAFATRQSRRRSIHDDFWLRQVAYPLIVHPIVGFITKTTQTIPPEATDLLASPQIAIFQAEFEAELDRHQASLVLLKSTVDKARAQAMYNAMNAALELIEDTVVSYCHVNSSPLLQARRNVQPRQKAISEIQSALAKFLDPIRDWQATA